MSDVYLIRVRLPDMKKAKMLTPSGGMTSLRIHAAQIFDAEKANRIAKEIEEQNPGAVAYAAKP